MALAVLWERCRFAPSTASRHSWRRLRRKSCGPHLIPRRKRLTMDADEKGIIRKCANCGQANRLPYARLSDASRCAKCHQTLGPVSEPVDIQSAAIFDALIHSASIPVLVDFWAPWCGPCRMVAPHLVQIAEQENGRLIVAKVDTEARPELGQRFRITAIPTMVVFKKGAEVARQAGAMAAPGIRQ